ncbi:hypothetical protein EVAR_43591_1 [Eumeta japonica]|uniref:DUF4774 domain-containing protein n=1 Tax=Eumeta variegata TaxID=151549 RepID=A0A4C1XGS7_EUMVA|nr:hypothetical protein EVAR_43591_1 [Eumeta japonica]
MYDSPEAASGGGAASACGCRCERRGARSTAGGSVDPSRLPSPSTSATRHSGGGTGSTVVYLPYYGGAAGQYLAVTRDPSGAILDQRIVPADRVPGVAQKPASPESVERAVRALQILAAEALAERKRTTRTARLRALAAASVDLLQLLWRSGIGIDADSARYSENDVGEEGEDAVELETDSSTDEPPPAGLIADAKPVGIAVVGASGVAAARPVGTAVAASGVALARPVATAIAGLDPAAVGISLDLGHSRYGLRPSPTLFDRND